MTSTLNLEGEAVRVAFGNGAFLHGDVQEMKYDEDNKGAFPVATANWSYQGMTLRDYFAAAALTAIAAHKTEGLGWKLQGDLAYGQGQWRTSPTMLAEAAYRIADAMLKAREKEDNHAT